MSTISTSATLTNTDLNNPNIYTWPITVNGGTSSSPVIVTFSDNITLDSALQYFKIESEYVTIDGNNKNVTINGVNSYPGLVQNGTSGTNGYSNVTVQNINVDSISSILADSMGWIGHSYFGINSSDVIVDSCSSSGDINGENAGGICGSNLGSNGTSTISNCSSVGAINGLKSGGICGGLAGSNNGIVTVLDCSSSGAIVGSYTGGICGANAGINGKALVSNCSSVGATTGLQAGGICGLGFGKNGKATVSNCSSSGAISGNYSGGICGSQAGFTGEATISNCSSSGAIGGIGYYGPYGDGAGGICGLHTGSYGGTITVSNCYSSGDINASGCGGICGSVLADEGGTATISNCYSSGAISGAAAGGICGKTSARNGGTVTVLNCYSSGVISGQWAGGIYGANAGGNGTGTATVSNSYTSGAITGARSGGICGAQSGDSNTILIVTNCYTSGAISHGVWAGGIYSTYIVNQYLTNTYVADGDWSDANANNNLKGNPTYDNSVLVDPIGSVWTDITQNSDTIPWILTNYVLTYTLNTSNNTAFVSGNTIGITPTDVVIPSTITDNNVVYSVTGIGDDAFLFCTGLISVTIPDSVTSIGDSAFKFCSDLMSITFETNSTLDTIGNNAFESCTSLSSITIPDSVTSIGSSAFESCSGLTSVTIPNSVTSIEDNTFESCSGLTSVTIPNSVTNIGTSAFESCSGLSSITIPNSVTSIGDSAFLNCPNLINAVIYDQSKITVYTNSFTDVSSNYSSSITFYNTDGSSNLYENWKTISTYYTTTIYYAVYYPTITNFYDISVNKTPNIDLSFTLTDPTSNSDGTFSYSSSNTLVAEIDGNIITVKNDGSSTITATQDASGIYSTGTATTTLNTLLISNICFIAGSLVTTDQGIIAIEKINPNIHTINGKKIVEITQSISSYDFLICFEKNALGNNIPSQKTCMTHVHKVFYKGKLRKAIEFVNLSDNVYKTKYKGQVLYNVLMDKHEIIEVNNLNCESLNPINPILKLYKVFKNCSFEQRQKLAREYNECTIANNKFNKKQLKYFKQCL